MTAVTASDLVETLRGKGPFKAFVPTDKPFAKLTAWTLDNLLKPENKKKLKGILANQVLAGKVDGQMLTITLKDAKVMVDNANVVQTDVAVGNGVIHVIDAVVLPK